MTFTSVVDQHVEAGNVLAANKQSRSGLVGRVRKALGLLPTARTELELKDVNGDGCYVVSVKASHQVGLRVVNSDGSTACEVHPGDQAIIAQVKTNRVTVHATQEVLRGEE